MDGRLKIMAGDDSSYLEGSVETPLSRHKIPNEESYCTIAMENVFVRKKMYVPNHPYQMYHEDHLTMMMAHAYTPL